MALHRWKPGESGNPLGRPRGAKNTVESYLRRYLAKGYEPDAALEIAAEKAGVDYKLINRGATIADVLAQIQIQKALRGDQEAYREVVDRTEGRPVSSVDLSGSIGVDVDFMQPDEVQRIKAELKAEGFVLPSWMDDQPTPTPELSEDTDPIIGVEPDPIVDIEPNEIKKKQTYRVEYMKSGYLCVMYVSADNALEAMQIVRELYSIGEVTELKAEIHE
jgi:hypothetical protein